MEEMPAARKKMVAGGIWMLARSLFSFFLSPPGIVFIFIRCNCPFAGKTNPPFFLSFFFWRGLMESRFHYNNVVLIITSFCCSIRPMFLVTCGLSCFLSIVVCHLCLCCFYFYNRYSCFYLLYLVSKGIFHLGGLISSTHTRVYMSFTEWECFCFSSFIEYNFGIMNI